MKNIGIGFYYTKQEGAVAYIAARVPEPNVGSFKWLGHIKLSDGRFCPEVWCDAGEPMSRHAEAFLTKKRPYVAQQPSKQVKWDLPEDTEDEDLIVQQAARMKDEDA